MKNLKRNYTRETRDQRSCTTGRRLPKGVILTTPDSTFSRRQRVPFPHINGITGGRDTLISFDSLTFFSILSPQQSHKLQGLAGIRSHHHPVATSSTLGYSPPCCAILNPLPSRAEATSFPRGAHTAHRTSQPTGQHGSRPKLVGVAKNGPQGAEGKRPCPLSDGQRKGGFIFALGTFGEWRQRSFQYLLTYYIYIYLFSFIFFPSPSFHRLLCLLHN